jgi:hypothetical protein
MTSAALVMIQALSPLLAIGRGCRAAAATGSALAAAAAAAGAAAGAASSEVLAAAAAGLSSAQAGAPMLTAPSRARMANAHS